MRSNKSVPGSIEYIIDSKLRTTNQELSTALIDIGTDISDAQKSLDSIDALLKKYDFKEETGKLVSIRFNLLKKILLAKNETRKKQIINEGYLIIMSKISTIVSEYNITIGQRTKVVNDSKQIIFDETEKIISKLKEIIVLKKQLQIPVLDNDKLIQSIKKDYQIIKLDNFKINKDIVYEDITEYFDSAIGTGQSKILKSEFSTSGGKNASLYPINLFNVDKVATFGDIFVTKGYANSNIFRLIPNKFIQYDIMIKILKVFISR